MSFFLIWPPGQKLSNFFVAILVQTMTPKGHFEINWPLVIVKIKKVLETKWGWWNKKRIFHIKCTYLRITKILAFDQNVIELWIILSLKWRQWRLRPVIWQDFWISIAEINKNGFWIEKIQGNRTQIIHFRLTIIIIQYL